MNFKEDFQTIYQELDNYNSHPTEKLNDVYICLIKASFVKCVEFNLFLQNNSEPKNSFFYTPFLRGICEDLITLKYLKTHFVQDRNDLLDKYMKYLLYTSLEAQTAFLDKTIPKQISPKLKEEQKVVKTYENELKKIMVNYGLNKHKLFPSVEHMAIDGKLKHLYDFFYHATSRMVHFSPNILLRMGWYNESKGTEIEPTVFSSTNFYKYYEQFNKFYAAFLFIELSKAFKNELNFTNNFNRIVNQFKRKLTQNAFYPELVTFEELNLKRPGEFMKWFLKAMSENKK